MSSPGPASGAQAAARRNRQTTGTAGLRGRTFIRVFLFPPPVMAAGTPRKRPAEQIFSSLHDLDGNSCQAAIDNAELASGRQREIDHAPLRVGAAVGHFDDNALAGFDVGDANHSTER